VSGTVAGAPGAIASYAYTLDASGHRTGVTELSGRKVNYGYDNLYRLTSETIASDPNSVNGAVGYGYDPVGNRLQKTSTLPGMPGTTSSYNANDQLASDTYDNDGNTTASNGKGYSYDFENHLVQQAGITVVYDGDGNRVAKTTANGTTQFLVDDLNPTGYAQVMDEVQSGSAVRTYTWGLELISEHQSVNSTPTTSYYVFDGHGSVRALTNAAGAVSDTYDYDAFGILLHSTGTTPNNYLFAGEQFDPDLGFYYNRARYLNISTGRFWTRDDFEGDDGDGPEYGHKYLFANSDPVNGIDPSGHQTEVDEEAEISVDGILQGIAGVLFIAYSAGILNSSGREPYLSRREREENPGKWLYAFGNNSRGPSDPRILGYNNGPNQKTFDLVMWSDGTVGPEIPPKVSGASAWLDPETAPLTGYVYKVQKDYVQALPTLGVWADGSDAVPPGPQPKGHHTIYPAIRMTAGAFVWIYKTLPWEYVYRKKTQTPVEPVEQ